MNRKAPTPTVTRPKPVDVPDLFDESARWTHQEDGFWIHDGPVWFKELYFTHVFEVLKPKKGFIKQAKVRWVIYAQDDHYIECELDDTTFSTRERIGGKWNPQIKHAHKTGSEGFVRVEITVASDHVIQKVGQAIDRFNGKVGGRTGFDGKFGLRLVK
jgi:hypothetical protein